MPTMVQAQQILKTAFNTGWGSTTMIAWENVPFSPPDQDSWVRFTVRNSEGEQTSLGQEGCRKFQRNGRIFIQLFTLEATQGTTLKDSLIDSVLSIMEGKSFSGVYTLAAEPQDIGPDGKWLQTNVSIPFWFQMTK